MTNCRIFPQLLLLLLVGCHGAPTSMVHIPVHLPLAAKAAPPKPNFDPHKLHPNELGLIPIVMYHDIGAKAAGRPPRYDRHGLNIRTETFRKHLRLMREAGWYPVNMRDALIPSVDVPAGKTPIVITFDDARGSQFRFLPNGRIDPDSAVAILEEFNHRYPEDWPLRATFFVMPRSKWNPAPFYQTRLAKKKLEYLLERGFEIANHSTTHRAMTHMDSATMQWEIAECVRGIRKMAPAATMDTLALPYGEVPSDKGLWNQHLKGSDHDSAYSNQCALIAWGGPAYPRAHKKFDRRVLTRIGVQPGFLEKWILRLKPGKEIQPYVGDGDPNFVSVPRSLNRWVNMKALGAQRLYVWNDLPAKPVKRVARRNAEHPLP